MTLFCNSNSLRHRTFGLHHYPNAKQKNKLIQGLTNGFHTGLAFVPTETYECKNLLSCQKWPGAVNDLLEGELKKGYAIGPFHKSPFPVYRINPIGVVEGKFSKKKRLIIDLSAPHDSDSTQSLNDLINKDDFSLTYVKLDYAIEII